MLQSTSVVKRDLDVLSSIRDFLIHWFCLSDKEGVAH